MQSKNKKPPTAIERRHILNVKELNCSVCDISGPSEVHEIKQGQWFTSIALCDDCHRHSIMGLHGQRRSWIIRKMDELDALNITIKRIMSKK